MFVQYGQQSIMLFCFYHPAVGSRAAAVSGGDGSLSVHAKKT